MILKPEFFLEIKQHTQGWKSIDVNDLMFFLESWIRELLSSLSSLDTKLLDSLDSFEV